MKFFVALGLVAAGALATSHYALAREPDTDGDGLTDAAETAIYHTDPQLADTDGDGFSDGQEVASGYSPRHNERKKMAAVDSDQDKLPDAWEVALGTDLTNPDSDGDKYQDGVEVQMGYNPMDPAPQAKLNKLIKVDLSEQRLTYTIGDKTLESFAISSGVARLPTPKGEFGIIAKYPIKHYKGSDFDFPNTKWNLHFTTSRGGLKYYIHGAYWHNDFGKPKSHGCVNVSYSNMERLYQWAQVGTRVEITT